MGIAITLKEYFDNQNIHYDTVQHRRTSTALDSSRAAHIPAQEVAKAVVLQSDDGDYLMASVPADSHLSLRDVNEVTGKHYQLVSELQLQELFPDCSQGAIPAIGVPYNMEMLVDNSLLATDAIYIESGDHKNFLKLSSQEYCNLMSKMSHAEIRGSNIGSPRTWEKSGTYWDI
jgi:Ala-tRNA(Pro) deacylase